MKSALIKSLARELKNNIKAIDFALLFGSAVNNPLEKCHDIDIGVFLNTSVTLKLISEISGIVEMITKGTCDLSVLNTASEVLRFEALKGVLLFVKKDKLETYASFYSLTCREYEDKIWWMKRQLAYRGYT